MRQSPLAGRDWGGALGWRARTGRAPHPRLALLADPPRQGPRGGGAPDDARWIHSRARLRAELYLSCPVTRRICMRSVRTTAWLVLLLLLASLGLAPGPVRAADTPTKVAPELARFND